MQKKSIELLLDQHHSDLRIQHEAHCRSAKHYERLSRLIGTAVVILTTAAGTSVLERLRTHPHTELIILTGVAVFAAAALATVQTFLAYPALAEKHRVAALRYAELQRDTERVLAFQTYGDALEVRFAEIQARWNEADRAAPAVPGRVINRATRKLSPPRQAAVPLAAVAEPPATIPADG